MFLKESSPISVKEVRNLADKYRTVHPSKPIAKEVEIVANVGVTKESKSNQEQFNRTSRRDKWQQNNNQRSNSCGPNWKQRDYAQPNQRFLRWNDSPHNNFRRQNKGNFRGYSQRRPSRGRGMPSRGNYHGQRYEYASSASILFHKSDKTSQHQLNIVSGKINGTDCTVLRDTGCTCVGIRQSLLKPNDFTIDTATCQMFDGSEKKFRKATAFIETPFFTGKVTALALVNPIVDVILGNIIGVGDQPNLNEQSPTYKNDPDSGHKAHAYV
ncbi:hypothetical protein PoB_005570800, partial [Plakobranchus ocellatus]